MDADIAQKIEQYFSQYKLRRYQKGQIIIFADEEPEYVYYLVSGKVRKYEVSYRGDEVAVNIFMPHTFFPLSWTINRTQNHYFYKAETDAELRIAPVADVVAFIGSDPEVAYGMLRDAYRVIIGQQGRIVQLMAGTAKSRLIYELIAERSRFGIKQDGEYLLTITEGDLAARSGLSRETVNREIRKLKAKDLVAVSRQGIIIKDLANLKQQLKAGDW